jgi:hypothetical protein
MYRHRRGRWLRGLMLFIAGTLVVMVIGLVINAQFDSGQKPQAFPPTSLPIPPWDATTSSPSPSPSTARALLTGPVQVVQGAQLVNGVYLGFPHSTVGAVSAADEFATQIVSTLDPDRAAAVMRLVADPSYNDGPQQAAQGVASDRKSLGLAASGAVPPGFSFELVPVEYQVQEGAAGTVTVLLLSDFISTTPGQGTMTGIGVFPLALRWSIGDWKVVPVAPRHYSGITAEPDSPQAAALGWQELQS